MSVSLPVTGSPPYAIARKALSRWAAERLRCEPRPGGGALYAFRLSGSTCTNRPLEVEMTVTIDAQGRVESATSRPTAGDAGGCDVMCASQGDGTRFLADIGGCDEVIGLTLAEAAFRDWREEPSGCFCTAGNRRHKWRNVFQTLHFAATRFEDV